MTNYADIFPALKDKPYNTVDGVHYGIPHGRGSNLLMWRTDNVTPAPTNWAEMFDPSSPFAGKVTVYDAPIYIADAAVVLMKTKPDLGIKNPYALDDTQFQAAVDLLKQQKPMIGQYWVDYTKQMDAFRNGDAIVGTTWQVITNLLQARTRPVPVEVIKPEEGATGWSDTWMVNSKTKHLNCAYKLLDHIVVAGGERAGRRLVRRGPGQRKACALTADPDALRHLPRRRRRLLEGRLVLADARGEVRRRPDRRRRARTSTTGSRPGRRSRAEQPSTRIDDRPGLA